MKTGRKWDTRWVIGGALAVVALALLGFWLVMQLRGPEQASPSPLSYYPTQGWRTSTPEEHGFSSVKLAEGVQAIRDQGIPIHSLMLIHNGSIFLDASWYPYDDSTYHDLASVTKSVMTTVIGIAVTQGKLSLDAPMLSFFPERKIANRDARKERITVRHLVGMSSGLDCTEADDEKTLQQMWASEDWVQFALDRPVAWEPGSHWVYCGPAIHLLSAILQQATGMTTQEFANENLFKPLGIQEVYWAPDPQGYTRGWGDLALRPRDAAKLGLLFLNQGEWEGKQIISREWISQATQGYFSGTGRKEDYGYAWWVSPKGEDPAYYLASGRNGQRIQVIPAWNIIVVTTGGGYDYDQVAPYLIAALGDLTKPLPANPAGVEQLARTITQVRQPPLVQPVPVLPETARTISGKRFVFSASPAYSIKAMQLDLNDSAEAIFTLEFIDDPTPRVTRVGLDGVYRPSRQGRPAIARGHWDDDRTFVIDYSEGPGLTPYTLRLGFHDERVVLEIVGTGSIEGRSAAE